MRKTLTAFAALALAALTLTGCASGATSPADGTSASGGTGSAAPATRIEVTVSHGQIAPKPSLHHVHLGDRVQLTVTSDQADEVHLHGYDKEIEIQAGQPGTIDITADLPGIFEVELHKSDLQLLQLEVK
jgi:plastocyanin